jgi:hypothetical protein
VLSYRDAVWHKWRELSRELRGRSSHSPFRSLCDTLELQPECPEAFWTIKTLHPAWHVHQLLANLLAMSLAEEHRHGCRRLPRAETENYQRIQIVQPLFGGKEDELRCSTPLSVMSTLRTSQAMRPLVPASTVGWTLEEDTPGKPGWLSFIADQEISFDLHFQHGDLIVGFLRSYNNLGKAHLWVSATGTGHLGPGAATVASPLTLNGLWPDRKSELAKIQLSGVGKGTLRIHFRSLCHDRPEGNCKFKLLLLMSC